MKRNTVKAGIKIGATIGGLMFMEPGFMAGFYFGSVGALILLQKLMGSELEQTLFVRAASVIGIELGIS